jgi:uncharacterized protein YndB with AHSA1/START domain
MKFTTKEDIEAPIEFVFEQLSDFQTFERSALRRGAEVKRLDDLSAPGPGMAWEAKYNWRGRMRELQFELTTYEKPDELVITSLSESMGGHLGIVLIALSSGRTRMHFETELKPKTLTSRLLIQSLKLARGRLMAKLEQGAQQYAKELESRYCR